MDETRKEELRAQLEEIATTGGADAREALKTVAGAMLEALGPSDHARNVEALRKHGSKTPTVTEVPPGDLTARGRDPEQSDAIEEARVEREEAAAALEKEKAAEKARIKEAEGRADKEGTSGEEIRVIDEKAGGADVTREANP